MEVKNLKELAALVKIMRKNGIEAIEIGDFKLSLGSLPVHQKRSKRSLREVTSDQILDETPQYSDLDLALWSAGGLPTEGN